MLPTKEFISNELHYLSTVNFKQYNTSRK